MNHGLRTVDLSIFQIHYDEGILNDMFIHLYDNIMIFTAKLKQKKYLKTAIFEQKNAILNSFCFKILNGWSSNQYHDGRNNYCKHEGVKTYDTILKVRY